ncbi:PIN domain-containing protein [Enterobacter sp. MEB024]|uniref:PIN domain-containing protein n=1 Tax=Enterobacter sp. MEB024 TaxID=3040288 RepID=UPI00254BDDA0|nr:PIN domain-containing protein [Enterobacter sp. MEB024]
MTEKFTAILLDTSIYDQYGLKLEKGLLGKLSQFSRTSTTFLIPDVIYNEVKNHLERKIRTSRGSLEKAFEEAGDHLFFDGSELNDAKRTLIEGREVEGLGKSRLDRFVGVTDAEVLTTGDYVSVPELLERYFSSEAPFADTGKKKNEFPDAITLMAVQAWAEENGENVLAVARDDDWQRFCADAENLHYEPDLSKALAHFNEETAPYELIDNLQKALAEGQAGKFLHDIAVHLESTFDGFAPEQEADSYLYWEADGCSGGFEDFEFTDNHFTVIDKDENWVVIEAFAEISLYADGDFSLSVYDSFDKDHVYMGSITKRAEETYTSRILITISGDLSGSIDDLTVEDVEVIERPTSMDFGELELAYEPDEQDL